MPPEAGKMPLTCALNGCWPIGKHGKLLRVKEDDDEDWAPHESVTPAEHAAIERAAEHLDPRQREIYWTRYRELRRIDLEADGIIAPVRIDRLPSGQRPSVQDKLDAPSGGPSAPVLRMVRRAASRQERQLEALCAATDGKIEATHVCTRMDRVGVNDITLH
jgi:hypothetical protein